MNRVIVYIDGFNLYHGLVDRGWRRYLWLDICEMAKSFMMINWELTCTKYFTARIVVGSQAKKQRQTTYIEALQTLNDVEIIEGKYHSEPYTCYKCGFVDDIPSEKMTDVNIAIQMLIDAVQDKYDIALLVSGDADLVPSIKMIRKTCPNKRLIVAFPPERHSQDLEDEAHSSFYTNKQHFSRNQLPPKVTREDGFILERPITWV